MAPTRDDLADFAGQLASLARPIVLEYFRGNFDVNSKADKSPVTVADRAAEAAMRRAIEAQFPSHGIVGEEYGSQDGDAEFVWVLDPIDGTRSFIAGLPLFGTLIALCQNGDPIVGVIDHPALNERWRGVKGVGTTFNDAPTSCRPCARLADGTLYSTAPEMFLGDDVARFGACAAVANNLRYGTDCYAYALVAAGYGDAVIEAGMGLYDFLALRPVIEGAGGKITDWQGEPLTLASTTGKTVAAGDERVHGEVLALLAT